MEYESIMQSKILVVDNEREIINTLKISLESDNYRIFEVNTG